VSPPGDDTKDAREGVAFTSDDDGRITARDVETGASALGNTRAEALRTLSAVLDSGASDRRSAAGSGDAERHNALVAQYTELRKETRAINLFQFRVVFSGVGVLATLLTYAFYRNTSGGSLLFSLVPFGVGILILTYLTSSLWIVRLETHIIEIQDELDVSSLSYERRYAPPTETNRFGPDGPTVILGTLLLLSYAATAVVGYSVADVADLGVSRRLIGAGYVLFALVIVIVVVNYLLVFRRHRALRFE